jgi:hypothetical protein
LKWWQSIHTSNSLRSHQALNADRTTVQLVHGRMDRHWIMSKSFADMSNLESSLCGPCTT